MAGVAVYTSRPAGSGRLIAWGRDGDGAWYGLVTFRQRVRSTDGGGYDEIDVAAWLPADRIRESSRANDSTATLPRVDLAAGFPAPPGWTRHFAGLWIAGSVPPLPDGLEAVSGAAWRS